MVKKPLGQNIFASNASWTFGNKVWKTFDDHINKSIPLYLWCHQIGLELSDFFLENNSKVLDLGCSTGTFVRKLNSRHHKKKLRITCYDAEKNMILSAKKNNKKNKNIKFYTKDISKIKLTKDADLITSFFTFSFIKPSERQKLFNKVYKSLSWGGALIFFDKVRAPDARFQDIMTQIYTNYKIGQNFTPDEIISKSNSIKGVLEPFSSNENFMFLKRAGFKDKMSVFKFICFQGFIAIK